MKDELENKVARYDTMQKAKKVTLNSAYGGLGSSYFRYYSLDQAEAITLSGQLTIQWIAKDINIFLNKELDTEDEDYVLGVDTDSNYLHLEKVVQKLGIGHLPTPEVIEHLDQFVKNKLQPEINASFERLRATMNAYEQQMIMKREVLANKGMWHVKKNYMLNVWDKEGVRYLEPQVKITGGSGVKSDTPAICREAIKKAIKIIMNENNDALIEHIDTFRKKFYNAPFEDIASSMNVNNLDKYSHPSRVYLKGVPFHVRAALVFNHTLKQKGLVKNYSPVREGEKIKFCYLKLPNPLAENVIAVSTVLPPELGLQSYIDYDKQFEKTFLNYISELTSNIGWQTEETWSFI